MIRTTMMQAISVILPRSMLGAFGFRRSSKNMIYQCLWSIMCKQVPSDIDQNRSVKMHKEYEGWHRAEAMRRGASA
jgi:hypothetical protein